MKKFFIMPILAILTLFVTACGSDNNDEPDEPTDQTSGQTIKVNNESWFLYNESDYYYSLFNYGYNSVTRASLYIRCVKHNSSDYPSINFYAQIKNPLPAQDMKIGDKFEFESLNMLYLVNSSTFYKIDSITSGSITFAGYDSTKNTVSIKFNNFTFMYNITNKVVVNGTVKIKYEYSEY